MVLPNSHLKWTVIVQAVWKNNGVVIAPMGGAACHLATVGRENDGCFLVIPDILDFDKSKKYHINLYNNIFSEV